MALKRGWATLDVLTDGQTCFRDDALIRWFDARSTDGTFEAFDTVLFAGGGMGGYGAAAYSVASPGATALAVQPVATLDRTISH